MNKNIKKILFIAVINISLIFLIYSCFVMFIKDNRLNNLPIFKNQIENKEIDISGYETEHFPSDFEEVEYNNENLAKFCGERRVVFNENYQGKPIIILGSSYAYGHGLKKEDSFPYILSEKTKRPVYNFATCGSFLTGNLPSVEAFLMTVSKDEREKLHNTQDIIYVYMYDHINRYIAVSALDNNFYRFFRPSKLESYLNNSIVYKEINKRIKIKQVAESPNNKYREKFIKNVIFDSFKVLKRHFRGAKLTIILYDEKIPLDNHKNYEIKFAQDVINSSVWKDIEKETGGEIRAVHTKDIVGFVFNKDYKLKKDLADWHPNEKVWKLFTPLFVKKYLMD